MVPVAEADEARAGVCVTALARTAPVAAAKGYLGLAFARMRQGSKA
jgi:hypothetical protein